MKKIFIGGSRGISRLSKGVTSVLDRVIQKGFVILVGDANGADKSVQSYLFSKNYENVIVFCAGEQCRNNIGNWQTRKTKLDRNVRDFYYYSARDLEMVRETDYGFMIWDAKSKGTLNNMLNLLRENKRILVYLSSEKRFYTLDTPKELEEILARCDSESLQKLEEELGLSSILGLFGKQTEPSQLRFQFEITKDDKELEEVIR